MPEIDLEPHEYRATRHREPIFNKGGITMIFAFIGLITVYNFLGGYVYAFFYPPIAAVVSALFGP
jgi:hypothetical protein